MWRTRKERNEHYRKHRLTILAYQKWWRKEGRSQEQKDKERERGRVYREKNKERLYEYSRKREQRPERKEQRRLAKQRYRKKWRKKLSEAMRLYLANKRATGHSAGLVTKDFVARLLRLQKSRCAICQVGLKQYHLDHIHPLSRGGPHTKENLQILCVSCNCTKRDIPPDEFMRSLGRLL